MTLSSLFWFSFLYTNTQTPTHTHPGLFWSILNINCICLSGMSFWTRNFSPSVVFPLLFVIYIFFLISVPAGSLCYCSDSVVYPSLHVLLLFKKFPQLLIYLNSFPHTPFSCPWRLGIFWKMESVCLYHGYIQEND